MNRLEFFNFLNGGYNPFTGTGGLGYNMPRNIIGRGDPSQDLVPIDRPVQTITTTNAPDIDTIINEVNDLISQAEEEDNEEKQKQQMALINQANLGTVAKSKNTKKEAKKEAEKIIQANVPPRVSKSKNTKLPVAQIKADLGILTKAELSKLTNQELGAHKQKFNDFLKGEINVQKLKYINDQLDTINDIENERSEKELIN
jgi:hypothetical protein